MKTPIFAMAAALLLLLPGPLLRAQELPPAASPGVRAPARPHPIHHRRHRIVRVQPPLPTQAGTPHSVQTGAAGTEPAPVPNEDIGPPRGSADTAASVNPGSLSMHYPPLGNGYLPGSSPQDMANTQTPKVPGVTVKMPLAQARPETLPPPEAH